MQQQKELLADILLAEGKETEGEKVLEEIIEALQEEFPYDELWLKRVMEKFRSVKIHFVDRTEKNQQTDDDKV